jgi:flagellar basal body-associated protein FliL
VNRIVKTISGLMMIMSVMVILMVATMMIIIITENTENRTAENSCIRHSTHTAESANVEAQKSLILQTALYAPLTVRAE